jgi:ribonuclease J
LPPSLTCFGGIGEIGGNKFLIQDRDTKVFFDFGTSFSEEARYFSKGIIEPRNVNKAGDLFEFKILPEINGLYSKEALENGPLKYRKPEIDGIFVSHYHYDHFGRVEFVDEDIPVFCGETTRILSESAGEINCSPLDGHKLKTFRTGDKVKVGSLEVVPVHVDHSVPGAYGFIIHTSEGAITYTGDLRFHGPEGRMTYDFISEAFQSKPKLLLTEGTRVSENKDPRTGWKEADVIEQVNKLMKENNKSLFVTTFRGNDIDRINSINRVCQENNRTLLVSLRTAHMLKRLEKDTHLSIPRIGEDVMAYIIKKGSGTYDDRDYYKWERELLDTGIISEEVSNNQSKFVVHLDTWHFPELVDIRPNPGGVYIHSSSEPFGEEADSEEDLVRNWVAHFGMSYHQIHASGHASMEDIGQLIVDIDPVHVLPIHTEAPFGVFSKLCKSNIVNATRRESISLREL